MRLACSPMLTHVAVSWLAHFFSVTCLLLLFFFSISLYHFIRSFHFHIAHFKLIFRIFPIFLFLSFMIYNHVALPDIIICNYNIHSFQLIEKRLRKREGTGWSIYLYSENSFQPTFRSVEGAPLSSGRTLSTNLFNAIWMGVLSMHTTGNQRVPSTRRERTSSF